MKHIYDVLKQQKRDGLWSEYGPDCPECCQGTMPFTGERIWPDGKRERVENGWQCPDCGTVLTDKEAHDLYALRTAEGDPR